MRNPFTPNFGQVPVVMAGRSVLIDEIVNAFENAPGDPALTSLLVGARGTGKTALLSFLANDAQSRGWIAVNVPCTKGMLEEIYQSSVREAGKLIGLEKKTQVSGLTLGQLIGIEWDRPAQEKPTWYIRMSDVLDKLQEKDIGLVITVDEINPSEEEMVLLAAFYQLFIREERKISLLMAGLPSEVSSLISNKSVSFLRRASRYQLGRIDDTDIEVAFEQTVEQSGKQFEDGALSAAVEASVGFPFMMQLVGYRSWQAALNSVRIDREAVFKGIVRAENDMKNRVLKATLDELSGRDLDFLEAMLKDDGYSAINDISRRMGRPTNYISQYRSRLLERGIIGTRGRGKVGFDLPVLKSYLPEYLQNR